MRRLGRTSVLVGAWLSACVVALAGIAGCEANAPVASGAQPTAACAHDNDCPDGDRCAPEISACVAASNSPMDVSVQLSPPPNMDYALTQLVGVTLEGATPVDFTLPSPRRVRGRVRTANNPLEANVAATITASAPGDIPGTEMSFVTTSIKAVSEGVDYGYELLLAPTDAWYQVTVVLENTDFPPHTLPARKFNQEEERLDLTIPSLSEYYRVTGRIVSSLASGEPMTGVRVAAFSETTANASTASVVDEDGRFEVAIPPGGKGEVYRLAVEPTSQEEAIPSMTLTTELVVEGDLDLGDLELGPVPGKVTADIVVVDPDGAPVPDVAVRCQGTISGGTLTAEATTDAGGAARVTVRQGTFDCDTLPDASSGLGAARWRVQADESPTTVWSFSLSPKIEMTGVVRDHAGRAGLFGVSVIAVHRGENDPLDGREIEATTDDNGVYELRLEAGRYAFVLLPPEGSLQAVSIIDEVDIAVGGPQSLDFELPRPVLVAGSVLGAVGEPLAGVRVEFFRDARADDARVGSSESDVVDPAGSGLLPRRRPESRPSDRLVRVIGAGITDEFGAYQVVLPSL